LRYEVILKLGGKCAHCSFADERALEIDHVHNDGAEDRRSHSSAWGSSLTFLRKVLADTTGAYQILCSNCNRIKYCETVSYKSEEV